MNDTLDTSSADADADGTTRRRLLAALVGGGIAAVALPRIAGAADEPPLRDPADNGALNAAMRLETRLAATCAAALEGLASAADREAIALLRDHHVAYAQAIAGVLGPDADRPDDSPLADPSGAFVSVARTLAALERDASATHLSLIVGLSGVRSAALLASIASIESRHAAALEMVSGTGAIEASR
jgi:hypothetical protein